MAARRRRVDNVGFIQLSLHDLMVSGRSHHEPGDVPCSMRTTVTGWGAWWRSRLVPHLYREETRLNPTLTTTDRVRMAGRASGGVSSCSRIENHVDLRARSPP